MPCVSILAYHQISSADLSYGVRVATPVSKSSSRHNSSSSISDGLSRPPTFMARSRSSSFALAAACSRSSAKSSALSPENSLSEIRKSRSITLKRLRSLLVANSPSMKEPIWALNPLAQPTVNRDVHLRLKVGESCCKEITDEVAQEYPVGCAWRGHVWRRIDRTLKFIRINKPEHLG